MEQAQLIQQAPDGQRLEAIFLPEKGLNLISFKKGAVELIDQETHGSFEERFAGLGPLIGPHFHRRRPESIAPIPDESLFPHIARVKAKGITDPFSHGIARYAPWQVTKTENTLIGTLTGKDTWQGVPLSVLEGQNFKMIFKAELQPTGLLLNLSVVSDTDSIVGIHYYYRLPEGKGQVEAHTREINRLRIDLDPASEAWDHTFHPFPNPLEGRIVLKTSEYELITHYQCQSQENAWQLYHPKGASFVCIEPVSSQDPRHPNLSVSSLEVRLEIL